MPLNTQVLRNGEVLPIKWRDYHVAAMVYAAILDQPKSQWKSIWNDPDSVERALKKGDYPNTPMTVGPEASMMLGMHIYYGSTPFTNGDVTLTKRHSFVDATSGDQVTFEPGDVLRAFRTHKS